MDSLTEDICFNAWIAEKQYPYQEIMVNRTEIVKKQIYQVGIGLLFAIQAGVDIQSDPGVDLLLEKAASEVAEMNESVAVELYGQVLEEDSNNFEALWNISLLYSKRGHRLDNRTEMRETYEVARIYAERCLDNYPDRAECSYVYAVAEGRIADVSSPRDRVRASKEIKEYIDRTLELDPEHRGGWHLLGIWHVSVANLSRAERWAANLLFGGAPSGASNREAEEALKRAIELDPENILFNLDLARFYLETGRNEDAREVLSSIREMEIQDKDDPKNRERAITLLERLQ